MNIDTQETYRLTQSYKEEASKLEPVDNKQLHVNFNALVEKYKMQLKGDYIVHTIYKKTNGDVYSLIYADYDEAKSIHVDDVATISLQDGKHMHAKLKESGLAIDYLFIVAYYNYIDRIKGSICFNGNSIITKDF